MTQINEAIETLTEVLNILERYKDCEAKKPEKGRFYRTFNNSVVFIYEFDEETDAEAIVLKGGHGLSCRSGEKPGDTYTIDENGYVYDGRDEPSVQMVMGLAEKLDIEI